MGAAFFSGAAFSAVSGMSQMGGGGANALQSAFSTGVLFALLQGAIYKVCCSPDQHSRCGLVACR
jgi:hypothetical protein